MRILVDARPLRSGGIGRYLREILERWIPAGAAAELRLLGDPRELEPWLEGIRGSAEVSQRRWIAPPYHWKGQLGWAREWREWTRGMDVVFFPHWDVPLSRGGPPRVVTIHDLIHFQAPDGFPRWKRLSGKALLSRAVNGAERVVTVSEASRRDLLEAFPAIAEQLQVVPNGCGGRFRPLTGAEREGAAAAKWRAHRPFMLYVGPLKVHKNAALALEVLAALRSDFPELTLIQAGPREIRDPAVARMLEDPSIRPRFLQVGPVRDGDLKFLYGLSECLLHPALIEGFGLPPLEAMACGTPVIAADRASLPEVVGEGGLLLDPERPRSWIAAVRKCLSEPAYRDELGKKGPPRAARFSWERTAEATLNVLRSAAGGRSLSTAASPDSSA